MDKTTVKSNLQNVSCSYSDGRGSIDEAIISENYFVQTQDEAVKLQLWEASMQPLTIPSFFLQAVKKYAHRSALVFELQAMPHIITYKGYYLAVLNAAQSFIAIGLNMNETVAVACYNSAYHYICTLGAIFAGGVYMDLNNTKRSVMLKLLEDSKANFAVVDSTGMLSQIQDLRSILPHLKQIIYITEDEDCRIGHNVYTWKKFLYKSLGQEAKHLGHRLNQLAPNKCCAIFYTFNRTQRNGRASGVMMSHDNLTFMARKLKEELGSEETLDSLQKEEVLCMPSRILSYLSLNRAIGLVIEMLFPIANGTSVFFSSRNVWKGNLINTVKLVRPTLFFATNRVWILLEKKLRQRWKHINPIFHYLITKNHFTIEECTYSLRHPKKNRDVYIQREVKKKLGLDRSKLFLAIEGPLRLSTQKFFLNLGIPICDVLDSPYLSGPHCINKLSDYKLGSAGKELSGLQSRLSTQIPESHNGDIIYVRGRHVCMGLLHADDPNMFEDDEGYMCPGILVVKDSMGYIYVTKNIEDLDIVTLDNGCTVSCESVETTLKISLPIISNCMLIGHQKPFLVLLITLKVHVDKSSLKPTSRLTKPVQLWLQKYDVVAQKTTDLIQNKSSNFYEILDDAIIHINSCMDNKGSRIRSWTLLETDFSFVRDEIDPVTKLLNREIIVERYQNIIDQLYITPVLL